MERVLGSHWLWAVVICFNFNRSANKSNHPSRTRYYSSLNSGHVTILNDDSLNMHAIKRKICFQRRSRLQCRPKHKLSSVVWNITLLFNCFMLVSYLAYSSTLKIEVTYSDVQLFTRRYNPEDQSLHKHSCENLKFFEASVLFFATWRSYLKLLTTLIAI
jgi:hypothetical protein